MSDSLWPRGLQYARLPCLSPSLRVCSNSCPLSRWCHATISSSVVPFSSCPQSFGISVFSNELALPSGGQSVLKITLLLSSLTSELYHSSWTLTSDLTSFRGEDLETQREGQPINLWQHHGWAPEASQSPRPARLPRNWELPKDASKFIPGWGPWKPLFLSLDSHFISLLIKISSCRSSPLN